MKFKLVEISGFKGAVVGARLPMSKDYEDALQKSDSKWTASDTLGVDGMLGEDDLRILKNLVKADIKAGHGQPNSKALRMMHVQIAVTAPLYWWKEYDTYKVGTTANSTSTMHRMTSYPITRDCFEMDDFIDLSTFKDPNTGKPIVEDPVDWEDTIKRLEGLKKVYNEITQTIKNMRENGGTSIGIQVFVDMQKAVWKEIIRYLPESWLQTRMLDFDYQVLQNICYWRKNHKLSEWHSFCDFIRGTVPYAKELIFLEEEV